MRSTWMNWAHTEWDLRRDIKFYLSFLSCISFLIDEFFPRKSSCVIAWNESHAIISNCLLIACIKVPTIENSLREYIHILFLSIYTWIREFRLETKHKKKQKHNNTNIEHTSHKQTHIPNVIYVNAKLNHKWKPTTNTHRPGKNTTRTSNKC